MQELHSRPENGFEEGLNGYGAMPPGSRRLLVLVPRTADLRVALLAALSAAISFKAESSSTQVPILSRSAYTIHWWPISLTVYSVIASPLLLEAPSQTGIYA